MMELLSAGKIVDYFVAVERICIHEASDCDVCVNERGKIIWLVMFVAVRG